MSKTLIKGGCVLTLGTRTPNYPEADVLIEDGVIIEVGVGLRARGAELIDARDTIVMPGFVDGHRHAWASLFRNVGDLDLTSTLSEHFTPEDVYAATLISLLGAVEAGTTTVVDWCDVPEDRRFLDAAFQAHAESGLRTVLVHPDGAEVPTEGTTAGAFASGDLDSSNFEPLESAWRRARDHGLRIHAHLGGKFGRDLPARMSDLLSQDVTLVHCNDLDVKDFDAIAAAGCSVISTPTSEMSRGMGAPPVQELIDRNVRFGLGIDDERVTPGDMFAQMRALISVQHATYFDRKLAGKAGLPNLLTTREVIRYGTSAGASALEMDSSVGSIEVGKQADILVLRADRPNIAPINDPIGAVVWGMDTSNLDWVIVAGRPLMRGGVIDADVDRARALAVAAERRVSDWVAPMRAVTGSNGQ